MKRAVLSSMLLLALCIAGCGRPEGAHVREETLAGHEGVWFAHIAPQAAADAPPGILLLMQDAEEHAGPWLERFAQEGYFACALDAGQEAAAASLDWLRARANPEQLAVLAEGTLAPPALAAAMQQTVHGLVLIEPEDATEGPGLGQMLRDLPHTPVLVMARRNALSGKAAQRLEEEAEAFFELRLYTSAAGGMKMLAETPSALSQALYWLEETVRQAETTPLAPAGGV